MSYSQEELNARLLLERQQRDFFIFRYAPVSSEEANDATRLILDFKENRDEAVALGVQIVTEVLTEREEFFRGEEDEVYLVVIPSHSAGRPNVAGERLCSKVAGQVRWVHYVPHALRRVTTVTKSATAPPGQRPGYLEHKRSIIYSGPTSLGKRVIMFDDVYTRGDTASACRDILRENAGCQVVFGLFLGRTIR